MSIIIPVYNVRPYLREALEGVILQTYQNIEAIIVDDGSNDGSGAVCEEFAECDPRIKLIRQENLGLSAARNRGLDAAAGELIAFLDPDDAYYPRMIEVMVETMVRGGADIVVCGFRTFHTRGRMPRPDSEAAGRVLECSGNGALREMLAGRIDTAVWEKLYRAKLWEGIRFPEGQVYEGTRTTYKILQKAERVLILPQKLVMHRVRSGSITQTESAENVRDLLLAGEELAAFVAENTPGIFSVEERDAYLESQFRGAIVAWSKIERLDLPMARELRTAILQRGAVTDRNRWQLRTKAGYAALRYCPPLARLALPAYEKVTRMLRRCSRGAR